MKKKEEEQSAKLIRCGMGLVLGGVAALAVCFVFLLVASAGTMSSSSSTVRDWQGRS